MAEESLDKEYIDTAFMNQLNAIDNESLKNLGTLILSTYKTEYNYEDLDKLNQECSSLIDNDLNTEHFLRQLKYLFNKGIYSKVNKRYKAELVELGMSPEKMEILCEIEKQYFDANLEKNEEADKHQIYISKCNNYFNKNIISYF